VAPLVVEFAGIENGWKVLDVGSGTGVLSLEIARRFPACRVTGIDASKDFVQFTTASCESERVCFEVGDAQMLRFGDSEFEVSLSLLVFNFIPDARKAAMELKRVTRAGGPVCAAVWDYGAGMEMLNVFWETAVALDTQAAGLDERGMKLCRRGELKALWLGTGFGHVEERTLEIRLEFASFDAYWEPFLEGIGPAGAYVVNMDRDMRERLKNRLRERLDGRLAMSARAWGVRGVRAS
jgi:SAM-dependent methyltransferase